MAGRLVKKKKSLAEKITDKVSKQFCNLSWKYMLNSGEAMAERKKKHKHSFKLTWTFDHPSLQCGCGVYKQLSKSMRKRLKK